MWYYRFASTRTLAAATFYFLIVCDFGFGFSVEVVDRRRRYISHGAIAVVTTLSSAQIAAGASSLPAIAATELYNSPQSITVPLTWTGEAYLIYYRINGRLFRAILDTGSPFLTVPGRCDVTTKSRWGCYRDEMSEASGLAPTYELFDGVEGEVEWRTAPFSFFNATGSMYGPRTFTFGVLSSSLMSSPGGVFFGLVRDVDGWIRPSFLGQTPVRSFRLDLVSEPRTLSLSTQSMIRGDYIKLVSDLRTFGDPTLHYTALARTILVNGVPLAADGKPIYAIFDTGVTGLVVSSELFEERYLIARERRERNLWGEVILSFQSARGKSITLKANKPVTTPLGESPWTVNGHLVVVGLSFLNDNKLLIDIDDEKLWIEGGPPVAT